MNIYKEHGRKFQSYFLLQPSEICIKIWKLFWMYAGRNPLFFNINEFLITNLIRLVWTQRDTRSSFLVESNKGVFLE